jgi:uncharacterized protein with von Willebrand factor type A (vWA) domain
MTSTLDDRPRDAVAAIAAFARELRHAGVAADHTRVAAAVEGLAATGVRDGAGVYWTLRLTLCSDPADLPIFDELFRAWFAADPPLRPPAGPDETTVGLAGVESGSSAEVADAADEAGSAASEVERLRHASFDGLSGAERAEVARLIALIRPRSAVRRSRRTRRGPGSRVDVSRTVRAMLRSGGEPVLLIRRTPRTKPRRVVLLLDVSGSMTPYADVLLRFAHATVQVAPFRTEVFTMGTRLTRITRQLRARDPEAGLRAAGEAIPDWSGGTRLGESLRAFLDRWGQRGAARQATVVLASDGWERGDATLLGEQAERLARLAATVVWVNPHRGKPGFAASTAGMQAVLPHIDHLVAGHNLAALIELAEVLADA